MTFTSEEITNQVCAIDQEAAAGEVSFGQEIDNLRAAVYSAKITPILKADPCFSLGIQVGYRLAEAKLMTRMLEGK